MRACLCGWVMFYQPLPVRPLARALSALVVSEQVQVTADLFAWNFVWRISFDFSRPEPYITWGTPNLKSVRELVYKRGFVKVRIAGFVGPVA